MPKVDIAPGLTLTDQQYEIAANGINQHTPELPPLTRALWTSNRWSLIPDELTGRPYKAQLVLDPDALRVTIITVWFEPDLRGGGKPAPHNHPWDFHSTILTGSYIEDRYAIVDGRTVHTPAVHHHVGEVNEIGREEYHEVTDVEPGKTMTLMQCGPGMANWGTLDPDTREITPNVTSSRFIELLRELNPHQNR